MNIGYANNGCFATLLCSFWLMYKSYYTAFLADQKKYELRNGFRRR